MAKLSEPFKLCLIFKFYKDHPKLEDIKQALRERWGVLHDLSMSRFDRRHVFVFDMRRISSGSGRERDGSF